MRFFYVNRHKFGFQISGFVKRYNFSRSDIADEFGADRSEGAAFRGENPALSRFPMQSGFKPYGSRTR